MTFPIHPLQAEHVLRHHAAETARRIERGQRATRSTVRQRRARGSVDPR